MKNLKVRRGNAVTLRYTLNWSKQTGQVRISGRSSFADGDVNSTGRCTWIARKTGKKK